VDTRNTFEETLLHVACSKGHLEAAQLLLNRKAQVNLKDSSGSSPLLVGCSHIEITKLLLRHPQVNVNLADRHGCTPLWRASRWGRLCIVKWMIALRASELDLNVRGDDGISAAEIARKKRHTEVAELLERLGAKRDTTVREIQCELGHPLVAQLFVLVVFLCDGLLRLREEGPWTERQHRSLRFFGIVRRLPMELQMTISHRVHGSRDSDIVLTKDSEPAFKALARSSH
jgi:hypothetical protein